MISFLGCAPCFPSHSPFEDPVLPESPRVARLVPVESTESTGKGSVNPRGAGTGLVESGLRGSDLV